MKKNISKASRESENPLFPLLISATENKMSLLLIEHLRILYFFIFVTVLPAVVELLQTV